MKIMLRKSWLHKIGFIHPRVFFRSSTSFSSVVWRSPAFVWLNVKFNGALWASGGNEGAGFVSRHFVGCWIYTWTLSWEYWLRQKKIVGVWHEVWWAIQELGARRLRIEGYFRCVINWLSTRWWTVVIVRLQWQILRPSEVENYMAKGGPTSLTSVFDMQSAPNKLQDFLF